MTPSTENSAIDHQVIATLAEKDIPALVELENLCLPEPFGIASAKSLLTPPFYSLLAWREEKLAGAVTAFQSLDEAEILTVAVHPDHRRRHIARDLLESLMVWAKGQGIKRLTLEVRVSNQAAIALYRSLGFTEDGVRQSFYQKPCEDAILMSFSLD